MGDRSTFRLRACLKKPVEHRRFRFGVPPLGGFHAAPPKSGTPNLIIRHALRDDSGGLTHGGSLKTESRKRKAASRAEWRIAITHRPSALEGGGFPGRLPWPF